MERDYDSIRIYARFYSSRARASDLIDRKMLEESNNHLNLLRDGRGGKTISSMSTSPILSSPFAPFRYPEFLAEFEAANAPLPLPISVSYSQSFGSNFATVQFLPLCPHVIRLLIIELLI